MNAFAHEVVVYVSRIKQFTRADWLVYLFWVGGMLFTALALGGFLLFGAGHGVTFPIEAWLVPIGTIVFGIAIAVDTIGHRTIYKEVLKGAEQLVHHVTIAAGVGSCVALLLAWQWRAFAIPAAVLTAISVLYSLIDEAFHWQRYASKNADRVEMWSHALILLGHGTMMAAWWTFYLRGYPGVDVALRALFPA